MDETNVDDAPRAVEGEVGKFAELKADIIKSWRARSAWREEATRAFEFEANYQWSDDDKNKLKDENRVAVGFNRVAVIIKSICGLEVNNRQTTAFLPREQGDVGPNEMFTNAGKWLRDRTLAAYEESDAFHDMAVCGEGWTESRMDYGDDPQGKFAKERVDPLEMGVNEGAHRANYTDARLIYRVRMLNVRDARDLFDEEYEADAMHARWLGDSTIPEDGGDGNKRDYPDETRAGLKQEDTKRGKVRIIQVQWWEYEPIHLVAVEGVEKVEQLKPEEFKLFEERAKAANEASTAQYDAATAEFNAFVPGAYDEMQAPPPPELIKYEAAKTKRKKYYQAFLGEGILGKVEELPLDCFQFKAMTAERDRKAKCFYGVMRNLFDPQMWANKWLSQSLHIMNTNAKGGLLAETDAFTNVRKAQEDWADNTKIVWVKPGTIAKNKIKERQPPQMPQGLSDLMNFALTSIRDVTGVNLELLGQADREQAASLEMQRRQSAMTTLATLFDSLHRYRIEDGKLLLKFVNMIPEGELVRVVGPTGAKYVPFNKQGMDIEKFDTIVDQAPTSPDQKQATWAITQQLMQGGVELPMQALIVLLKYSPYPESVVEEIKTAMGMGAEMPPEMMKQKLQQAEQALQVMEEELTKALKAAEGEQNDTAIELLKTMILDYKAETERMKMKVDALTTANQTNVDNENQEKDRENNNENQERDRQVQVAGKVADASAGGAVTRDNTAPDLSGLQAELTDIKRMLAQAFQQQAFQQQPTE